jgi:predicted AlkP superfamily phosphohydrolase/phosphomutase
MRGLRAEDRLILVGVRGLRSVRRSFNVTAWLVKERYCVLGRKAKTSSRGDFGDYEWHSTRAWAAGAGGIYLNLEGREPLGVVSSGKESEELLEEIRTKLLALRDEGRPVVREVIRGSELFKGPAAERAPDLMVLLHPGYGVGPAGRCGAVPARVFQDSTKPWIPFADGSHPAHAHGVLMTTFAPRGDPSVLDVAPTVLGFFGIKPPPSCSGLSFW